MDYVTDWDREKTFGHSFIDKKYHHDEDDQKEKICFISTNASQHLFHPFFLSFFFKAIILTDSKPKRNETSMKDRTTKKTYLLGPGLHTIQ